jgi:hypothetical protein
MSKLFNMWHNPTPQVPELEHKAPPGSPEWYAETAKFWHQMAEFWRQQEQFRNKQVRIQKQIMWLWAVLVGLLPVATLLVVNR